METSLIKDVLIKGWTSTTNSTRSTSTDPSRLPTRKPKSKGPVDVTPAAQLPGPQQGKGEKVERGLQIVERRCSASQQT